MVRNSNLTFHNIHDDRMEVENCEHVHPSLWSAQKNYFINIYEISFKAVNFCKLCSQPTHSTYRSSKSFLTAMLIYTNSSLKPKLWSKFT